jgi:hypothetical protein
MKMVKVISVEPMENYKLRITLSDNRKGMFDVSPYLDRGVFKELKDPKNFRRVYLAYGTVVWPHELDIAPETIEMELQPEPAANKSRSRVA